MLELREVMSSICLSVLRVEELEEELLVRIMESMSITLRAIASSPNNSGTLNSTGLACLLSETSPDASFSSRVLLSMSSTTAASISSPGRASRAPCPALLVSDWSDMCITSFLWQLDSQWAAWAKASLLKSDSLGSWSKIMLTGSSSSAEATSSDAGEEGTEGDLARSLKRATTSSRSENPQRLLIFSSNCKSINRPGDGVLKAGEGVLQLFSGTLWLCSWTSVTFWNRQSRPGRSGTTTESSDSSLTLEGVLERVSTLTVLSLTILCWNSEILRNSWHTLV